MEETRKGILSLCGQRPVRRRGTQKQIMKQGRDMATVWTEPGFLEGFQQSGRCVGNPGGVLGPERDLQGGADDEGDEEAGHGETNLDAEAR